ncbi:MAG: methylamine utilization protein [Thermoanaerobaculia bacterium]|nr:methylamine utilization protein [Thermoanaerobaculia bacterium]
MISIRMIRTLVIAALIVAAPGVSGAELDVEVLGDGGEQLSDAVVWAVPKEEAIPTPAPEAAVMDQRNRTFIPHVLPIQTGTAVRFPNNDNVRHQVYSFSPSKTFQLPLYIGEPPEPVRFTKSGIVSIGCNIHDQMSAWIVVVDTPFFARSGDQGKATLKDLAPGEYEIHVWHPRMGEPQDPLVVSLEGERTRELTIGIRTR